MLSIVGETIQIGPVPFNIYTLDQRGLHVLFCRAGYSITVERRDILAQQNRMFYVDSAEMASYLDYAADNISPIIENQNIPTEEKVMVVKSVGNRLVQRILQDPKSGGNIKKAGNFVNSYMTLLLEQPAIRDDLFTLATKGGRYLLSRSFNVCTLCLLLGVEMFGRDQTALKNLGIGGLLLDVGMTKIDSAIIEKPGSLTDEEVQEVRFHPIYSEEILKKHKLERPIIAMARSHHERLDGSGYPDGISARGIHPYAQLAAVADTYDAITSDRPYKDMESHLDALEELNSQIDKFNKDVFLALLKVVLHDEKLIAQFVENAGLSNE